MPFGQYIPYNHLCKRPQWTKPHIKTILDMQYPKMREFFDFIDEEPKPFDLFHTFKNTRLTTPWNGQRFPPIEEFPDLRKK